MLNNRGFRSINKLNLHFFIFFIGFSLINGQQLLDCMQPYCTCLNRTSLFCNNFTRFNQLDFSRLNGNVFESVELRPLTMVDLNENLVFNGLKLSGRLTLCNVKSFSAFYNPFRQIFYDDKFSLVITNSFLKFLPSTIAYNPNEAAILEECNYQRFFSAGFNYIFANLILTEFTFSGVYFERKICPILFSNTRMFSLILNDATGAFGFETIKAVPLNIDVTKLLNIDIYQIEFNYNGNNIQQPQWLDSQYILNPFVFDNLDRVILNSAQRFEYIQERTFEFLPSVRKLEINNMNMKDLLLKSRRWLKNLNFQKPSYDVENLTFDTALAPFIFQLIIWVDNNEWNLDDEKDICLFKSFPHDKLVFPFLLFSNPASLKCTCTIYWLYKYFYKYQIIYNLNQLNVPFHCFQQATWDNCQFDVLFNRHCPDSITEPEELFTTLLPSTDFVIPTQPQTLPTQTISTISTISSISTLSTVSFTPSSSTFSNVRPSSSTQSSTRSSFVNPITTSFFTDNPSSSAAFNLNQNSDQIPYAIIAFYLAIALSVVAAFTTAAVIVLCYKIFRKSRPKGNKFSFPYTVTSVTRPNIRELPSSTSNSDDGETEYI